MVQIFLFNLGHSFKKTTFSHLFLLCLNMNRCHYNGPRKTCILIKKTHIILYFFFVKHCLYPLFLSVSMWKIHFKSVLCSKKIRKKKKKRKKQNARSHMCECAKQTGKAKEIGVNWDLAFKRLKLNETGFCFDYANVFIYLRPMVNGP